ncbi:hypothetical protein NBRC13296_12530 [Paenibacillus chitinolyticus]|uniref:hypothetical protein n=1 Tax=Paenibacillus chitinolyticus TaxID=79263 RepID=UPI003556AA93
MKSWNEIEGNRYFYLAELNETTDDDDNDVILDKYTKLKFEYAESNEMMFMVAEGIYEGFDLYFYTNRDKPEDLLTEKEYLSVKHDFIDNEPKEVNALRWVVDQFEKVLRGDKAGNVEECLSYAHTVLKKYPSK